MVRADRLNDDEFAAIHDWSLYGQRGDPLEQRTTASDWQNTSFEQPMTAVWDPLVPYSELPKLLLGFKPRAMEDKWFVYTDGPDAQGNSVIHMHRSWTGYKNIEARFLVKKDDDGNVMEEDAYFTEIMWESSNAKVQGLTEDTAKERAKEVFKWCMDVRLP